MAQVLLDRDELERFGLPPVCVCCGAPATVWKKKKFSHTPSWVWLLLVAGCLPFLIVSLVVTHRVTLSAPLCEKHKDHWLWRSLVVVGSLVGLGIGFIVTIILTSALDGKPGEGGIAGLACVGWVVLGLAWLVLAGVLEATSVRVDEITRSTIFLKGVAEDFRASVRVQERRYPVCPEDDEALKPFRHRQPPGSQEYFDPDAKH